MSYVLGLSSFKLAAILGFLTFSIYFLSNTNPSLEYKYYVYLAESLLQGRVDVPNLPNSYYDFVVFNDKKYIPFSYLPAVLVAPLVAVFGTSISETRLSQIIGGVNIFLLFLLLKRIGISKSVALVVSLFFAFGTVHWYVSSVGWSWFFAHVLAIFFLLLALLEIGGKRRLWLVGFLVALAGLSRQPIFLSIPLIFLLAIYQEGVTGLNLKKITYRLTIFLIGISIPTVLLLFYNYARFGSFLEQGYLQLYQTYTSSNIAYSFYRNFVPSNTPHFGYIDIRNIPLALYTMFFMAPDFLPRFPFIRPSPYGMSLLLTSPLFILVFISKAQKYLKYILWIAIIFVALPTLLHYAQGWVQFGYRFVLDYIVFLLILLSLALKDKVSLLVICLLLYSFLINLLGINWALGKI